MPECAKCFGVCEKVFELPLCRRCRDAEMSYFIRWRQEYAARRAEIMRGKKA